MPPSARGACILAENNSTEGQGGCPDDEIRISRGDHLPGLPKHNLKLGLDWNLNDRLRVGATVLAYSGQYVRGNENNRHRPGGAFEGSGKLPGYAVVNLSADYRFAPGWTLFGRVDNLFDKRYATGGALAENPFVGAGNAFAAAPDEWRHEQFIAPGAPRAAWLGGMHRKGQSQRNSGAPGWVVRLDRGRRCFPDSGCFTQACIGPFSNSGDFVRQAAGDDPMRPFAEGASRRPSSVSRGEPTRSRRCRSFSSASSRRMRAWPPHDRDRPARP